MRNEPVELLRRLNPKNDRLLGVVEGLCVRASVCHAARKFGDIRDERLILGAPENYDLVLVFHGSVLNQMILQDNRPDLFDLIGLGVCALALKVDALLDSGPREMK